MSCVWKRGFFRGFLDISGSNIPSPSVLIYWYKLLPFDLLSSTVLCDAQRVFKSCVLHGPKGTSKSVVTSWKTWVEASCNKKHLCSEKAVLQVCTYHILAGPFFICKKPKLCHSAFKESSSHVRYMLHLQCNVDFYS